MKSGGARTILVAEGSRAKHQDLANPRPRRLEIAAIKGYGAPLVDHIIEVTQGSFAAASRRLDEVDDHKADILANPLSGVRLSAPLDGWLVRHGGRDHRLTVVFRPDREANTVFVALVAFGGQDWMTTSVGRQNWPD